MSVAFSGSIVPPGACRPPLPVDWFINQAQSLPHFSDFLNTSFKNASSTLSYIIDSAMSTSRNIEAVSVVVGGPWGIVYEHHSGRLRSNDSSDKRLVDTNSIYRIGSITKVKPQIHYMGLIDRYSLC